MVDENFWYTVLMMQCVVKLNSKFHTQVQRMLTAGNSQNVKPNKIIATHNKVAFYLTTLMMHPKF